VPRGRPPGPVRWRVAYFFHRDPKQGEELPQRAGPGGDCKPSRCPRAEAPASPESAINKNALATPYDRRPENYLAALKLAAVRIRLEAI
jgi:hypothetical protein